MQAGMMKGQLAVSDLLLGSALFFYLVPSGLACIYLLNGWTPMSVYKRTSFADIVLAARVTRTFKAPAERTEADTYSAEIRVLEVFKGTKLFRDIPVTTNEPRMYNVSNFGDKKMCYADVSDGSSYVLFLTPYQQRLSAKYDDIFGAAAEYTKHNVRQILEQIGTNLDEWTPWSSCTSPCNGGHQARQRMCKKKSTSCDGESYDRRQCNTFPCADVHNVLSYLGVVKLPLGVGTVAGRAGAFNITSQAKLFSPLSSIFRRGMPADFSLLLTLQFPLNYTGFFLTFSDLMGKQRLALQYTAADTLLFQYSDQSNLPGVKSPRFSVNLRDGRWHQLAFSVRGNLTTLYFDCDIVLAKDFPRSVHSVLGGNLMLALGPYFARYGIPFQGLIEQLVLTPDPQAASHQCHTQTDETDQAIKDDGDVGEVVVTSTVEPEPVSKYPQTTTNTVIERAAPTAEWSSWSACSASCGRGVQRRSLYCRNNVIEACVEKEAEKEQIRSCLLRQCDVGCAGPCVNGGTCSDTGRCLCAPGYEGTQCQTVSCPGCLNGGHCLSPPGRCACPAGFTGKRCETAVCEPPCRNGGSCSSPGQCTCPHGYRQPDCSPVCVVPCHNGGRCSRQGKCKCPRGYKGRGCATPLCRKGCYNGGRCVAPNTCSCPRGYGGARCQKSVCSPACQNNGKCLYPGFCMCKTGYQGALCERTKCKKTCRNGGTCSGRNHCACVTGYTGRWCHRKACRTVCHNKGKCRGRRCRCRPGFYGSRCDKRECQYQTYLMPYKRSYRKLEREEYTTSCGPWRWSTCVKTRVKYVTVAQTLYRPGYRCV